MRNSLRIALTVVLFMVMAAGAAAGYIMLSEERASAGQSGYSIAVDDEITLYAGDTYMLIPFLMREDGTVEESRFRYTPSTEDIRVSEDGVVSVVSIPDADEEVTIEVFERNTSVSAVVRVHVISRITNVLGITFSDADGNKTLISGEQKLLFGADYAIDVITDPRDVDLQDYCIISVTDCAGRSKEAFDIAFDGTHVRLSADGLGEGVLSIRINDDDGKSLYSASLDFAVCTANETLGGEILRAAGETLLSVAEVDAVTRITLSDSEGDLSELCQLGSLSTVVLKADTIASFENAPQGLCWRVPESLFAEYLENSAWAAETDRILPYRVSADERYVVYHGIYREGEETIEWTSIYAGYTLPVEPQHLGYKNTGWTDTDGKAVASGQVADIAENGIHLYAVWEPVKFTVVYNVRGADGLAGETREEAWDYDTRRPLTDLSEFSDAAIAGFKFSGWTDDAESSIYGEPVYRAGTEYGNLSMTEDAVVALYEVWEPITYTLRFAVPADAEPTVNGINEIALKYTQSYSLPAGVRRGYTFLQWADSTARYSAGQSVQGLSAEDGGTVELTAEWSENSYTILFDPAGGTAAAGESLSDRTLRYTQPTRLPLLERPGYVSYEWYADLDGDGRQSEGEPVYNATATISGIVDGVTDTSEVWLRAVWSQSRYTVTFNLNGGERLEGDANIELAYEEYFQYPMATRTGYTLLGWQSAEGDLKTAGTADSRLTDVNGGVVAFTAQWQENRYTVKFDAAGGSVTPQAADLSYTQAYSVPAAARAGYNFLYWSFNGRTYAAGEAVQYLSAENGAEVTLTAVWDAIAYSLIRANDTQGNHVSLNYESGVSGANADCGATVVFSIATSDHSPKLISLTWAGGSVAYTSLRNDRYSFVMPAGDVTITLSCTKDHGGSCFVAGTMIATEKGYVAIENIRFGDSILSFNHDTGRFEYSEVVFTYRDYREVEIVDLYFDNGTTLSLANIGQGLYDRTLNRYVLVNAQNAQEFIGHSFASTEEFGGGWIAGEARLLSIKTSREEVWRYDVVTKSNLNHIANGFLACSDVLVNICNMFEFNEDMMYDAAAKQADIEKYGLYTYEEWSAYVTYEEFTDFNGAYFKVAVGKGLLTVGEIFSLIEVLLSW